MQQSLSDNLMILILFVYQSGAPDPHFHTQSLHYRPWNIFRQDEILHSRASQKNLLPIKIFRPDSRHYMTWCKLTGRLGLTTSSMKNAKTDTTRESSYPMYI